MLVANVTVLVTQVGLYIGLMGILAIMYFVGSLVVRENVSIPQHGFEILLGFGFAFTLIRSTQRVVEDDIQSFTYAIISFPGNWDIANATISNFYSIFGLMAYFVMPIGIFILFEKKDFDIYKFTRSAITTVRVTIVSFLDRVFEKVKNMDSVQSEFFPPIKKGVLRTLGNLALILAVLSITPYSLSGGQSLSFGAVISLLSSNPVVAMVIFLFGTIYFGMRELVLAIIASG